MPQPRSAHDPLQPTSAATIAEALAAAARRFADAPALLCPNGWATFAELDRMAAGAARRLREAGVLPGGRVVLCLPNSAVFRVLEHAVLRHGMVRVALSPRLHAREVAAIAIDAQASVVCAAPEQAPRIAALLREAGHAIPVLPFQDSGGSGPRELAAVGADDEPAAVVEPGDLAMLLYSSGTTGAPKAAMISHAAWMASARSSLACLPAIGVGDVVLAVAPMPHFGGSIGLDCSFAGAATVPLADTRAESIAAALDEFDVTVLPLVPVLLRRITDHLIERAAPPARLRAVPYGGSSIDWRELARAAGVFPGSLHQMYGLAEALVPLTCLPAADHDDAAALLADPGAAGDPARAQHVLSSCGRPGPGVEVRADDEQKISVRSATVMDGYWHRP